MIKKINSNLEQIPSISHYGFDYSGPSRLLMKGNLQTLLYVVFGLVLLVVVLLSALTSPLLPVAFILALLLLVCSIIYPSLALFLIFVGAGLPTLLLPLPGHTLRLMEPVLLLCLFIIVLRRPFVRLRLTHYLLLLFLIFTIISFIHIPDIAVSTNDYGADKRLYDIILFVTAFFSGTLLVSYIKNLSSFLTAILLSNLPVYLIGLGQFLHIHIPSMLEAPDAQNPKLTAGRLWGPFPGAASFGLYLINLFAVALVCSILGNSRRDRIIGVVVLGVITLELVESGTRSAAVACVCLVILALIVTKHYKLLVGLIALAGGAVAIFSQQLLAKFVHPQASTSNRLFLWGEAIKLIRANPWVGIGMEQFHVYYAQFVISQANKLDPHGTSVHNQYLEWAMESGLPYLVVVLSLLLSIIITCRLAYRYVQPARRCILLTAVLAVLGNMMIAFLDVPFDKVEGMVSLFLLAGLAVGEAACMPRILTEKRRKAYLYQYD